VPRVGDEVVVDYLDGDPDQPLVVGSVYNATAPVPLSLPGAKTISLWRSQSSPNSGGHNHILMEDAAGKESFEIRAEREFVCIAGQDAHTTVGRNSSTSITGDSKITATKWELEAGELVRILSGGDMTLSSNKRLDACLGDHTVSTTNFQVAAGQDIYLTAEGSLSLVVGGSSITLTPDEIILKASTIKLNCS
jgi:type VI secretion system secreted protein VgrG